MRVHVSSGLLERPSDQLIGDRGERNHHGADLLVLLVGMPSTTNCAPVGGASASSASPMLVVDEGPVKTRGVLVLDGIVKASRGRWPSRPATTRSSPGHG